MLFRSRQAARARLRKRRLRDVITVEGDAQTGAALLEPVMRGGRRLAQPTLAQARARCRAELARLPAPEVRIAPALRRLADEVDRST